MILSEVKPGQQRVLRQLGAGTGRKAYHKIIDTGEEVPLLPLNYRWWAQIPLLVLQLEQGPTCTAAAAYFCLLIITMLFVFLLCLAGFVVLYTLNMNDEL